MRFLRFDPLMRSEQGELTQNCTSVRYLRYDPIRSGSCLRSYALLANRCIFDSLGKDDLYE